MRSFRICWHDENSRVPHYENVSADKVASYKGHDVYADARWFYVHTDTWNYFGTMHEAKRFISSLG